jgi:predicted alpha/beta superfamily hydrolase
VVPSLRSHDPELPKHRLSGHSCLSTQPSNQSESAIVNRILAFLGLVFSCACTASLALNGTGPSGGEKLVIGERFSMASDVLEDEREYWIYLPASYDRAGAQQAYPVLYLLDGAMHFQTATGVVGHMSPKQIPEMIVVGIPSKDRFMDLSPTESTLGLDFEPHPEYEGTTGGGPDFLRFIRDELFPRVDSTYRTTDHRIVAGHSAGGLLALHALLDQPDMFDAYLAMDPSLWWDNKLLVRQAEAAFGAEQDRKASVYVSLANNSDCRTPGCWEAIESSTRDFAGFLQRAESPDFQFSLQYFEQESHGSVPLISLYQGLLSLQGRRPN